MLEKVLNSCYFVSENSKYVSINKDRIEQITLEYDFSGYEHWIKSNPFNILDLSLSELINLFVIYDAIDFSFWGNPKWEINVNNKTYDGAFGLLGGLVKLKDKFNDFDFSKISFEDFSFALKGNVNIPLLKERYDIAKGVSLIIKDEMNGDFYSYIKDIYDDKTLFELIISKFACFKDERTYNGEVIYFYKLAQLLVSDIIHIRKIVEQIEVTYYNLVGCADYKIPQIMRSLGLISYNEELSNLVDKKIEIAEGSDYEIEIRASMIVVISEIGKRLNIPLIDINDFIWVLGQDKSIKVLPYHLTRTVDY